MLLQKEEASRSHTCAEGEGGVRHLAEVTVDALQAGLPLVTVVTTAVPVPAAGRVAVARPVAVAGAVRAPESRV